MAKPQWARKDHVDTNAAAAYVGMAAPQVGTLVVIEEPAHLP